MCTTSGVPKRPKCCIIQDADSSDVGGMIDVGDVIDACDAIDGVDVVDAVDAIDAGR